MSNQRPQVHFNNEEVCGPCLYSEYKHKMVDWDKREKELEELCNKYRKEDGSWEVIVPVSGGKDSSYTAYILKKKFGMHPLTVTWAPAIPTEIGSQNLYNFIQSGFDNILISPNGEIHQKFGDFWWFWGALGSPKCWKVQNDTLLLVQNHFGTPLLAPQKHPKRAKEASQITQNR